MGCPRCLLSSDCSDTPLPTPTQMTRRVLTEFELSLTELKLVQTHRVVLTVCCTVYPLCVPQILGGYLFLIIVMNQEFEIRGEKCSIMASHRSCQKALRIKFTLWKVPVFQVLLCTFIHSFTYSTDIFGCFLCAGHYAKDTGWTQLWVPRPEDKIEDKDQPWPAGTS